MMKGIMVLTTIQACLLFVRHALAKRNGFTFSDVTREPYRQSGIELDDGRKMYHNGSYYYVV